jgi:hypothetical protein
MPSTGHFRCILSSLFDDEEAMRAHMENLRKMEKAVDHASDLEMQVWDVQDDLSKVTKGPI